MNQNLPPCHFCPLRTEAETTQIKLQNKAALIKNEPPSSCMLSNTYLSLRFMCNAILSVSSWPPDCFLLSKLSPRPKPGTGWPRRTSTINGSVQCGQKLIPKLPLSVNSNHKAAISKIIMSFYCINSPVLCKGPSFQQWSTSVMIRRYRPMITPKCE